MYHATVLNQPIADDRQLTVIAAPASEEATGMQDQIIDAVTAAPSMPMRCERTRWRG